MKFSARTAPALLALATLTLTGAGAVAASASDPAPATAFAAGKDGNYDSDKNQPEYWEKYLGDKGYTNVSCKKVDKGFKGATWTADKDYALVVLKFAQLNQEFMDVKAQTKLTTSTGQDISHIITCNGTAPTTPTSTSPTPSEPTESSTTTPPADDTTPPADDTTPPADDTTPPADDTTPPADDTTTPPNPTDPGAGTGTVPPTTSNPTEPGATEPGTGTVPPPLGQTDTPSGTPTVPTTDDTVVPPLAQTGANTAYGIAGALGMLGAGAAFVAVTRRRR